MAPLGNRLQVLIDDERLRRLELRAKATGASVGALVRDAIDVAYPGVENDRERAGGSLLEAEPMPVADWDELKRDVESMLGG